MDTSITATGEPMWATIAKGVILTLFGLVALAWPGVTLVSLVWLVAVYILIAGIMDMVSGIVGIGKDYWWAKLLLGIAQLCVGVYLIQHPGISLSFFLVLVGFFFLIRGFAEVVMMFMPGLEGSNRFLLAFAGALSIIVGFYMLRYPVSSGLAFIWVIGLYAIIAGPISIVMGIAKHNR